MATFSKLALQPAGTTGTGLGIKVAATDTAGTAIHTAVLIRLQQLMRFGCMRLTRLLLRSNSQLSGVRLLRLMATSKLPFCLRLVW
jgi:hypothetical protein